MTLREKLVSPDGRYVVCVDAFEARAFQWVDTPEVVDLTTGLALLDLKDPFWHLDSADWLSKSRVSMRLRHFPDGVPTYEVVVDCEERVATLDGSTAHPLRQLDEALREVLASRP
ncbi:MAG: hypothetical protein CK429_16570 [Mycobacterium sp.]|nr:hypothetical protein [Mycobacterium gordonae]PJE11739.1 MAG: hypothetical protein CK429_16570 [Mycobacterium sp.]